MSQVLVSAEVLTRSHRSLATPETLLDTYEPQQCVHAYDMTVSEMIAHYYLLLQKNFHLCVPPEPFMLKHQKDL